ncbi:MAG: hypothetical protein ACJ8J7_01305 [Sulfurifustaceae bacterium]
MSDYLFRLEPTEQAAPLSSDQIDEAVRAGGMDPRAAVHGERRWYVQVRARSAPSAELALPAGWRVVAIERVLDDVAWAEGIELRPVGDVFTFILLTWPAVVGLFFLTSEGWELAAKIALAVWLVLIHSIAYGRGRGAFFGNSLLMLTGCVAAFWWTHPGPWMYLWLAIIVIGLYAAVRGVLHTGADAAAAVRPQPSGENG